MGIVEAIKTELLCLPKGNRHIHWSPLDKQWVVRENSVTIHMTESEDEAVSKLLER